MVSFIHAADLHLGMRITRFSRDCAEKVREARMTALDNILEAARERKVDFLVIAGDLFDDCAVDSDTARRAFEMLEASAAPVYVLPGNHDPLQAGGVWDRPPWDKAIGHLCVHREAKPIEVAPGVVLLPCPVLRKTSMQDPTSWIATAPRTNGAICVGIAHGSLKTRDDLPHDDHLIARHAAAELHLDYLALGHWHARSLHADPEGVARTAYCGVHEPMRFQGCDNSRTGWIPYAGAGREEFLDGGKGEVLLVQIRAPGAPPVIEPVEVGHFTWGEVRREVTSETDLAQLITEMATQPRRERRLLRLQLTGILHAAAMLKVDDLRTILANRYFLGELDDSGLHVQPTESEVNELAAHGILATILGHLQEEAKSAEAPVRQVAERAILLLYQITREVRS